MILHKFLILVYRAVTKRTFSNLHHYYFVQVDLRHMDEKAGSNVVEVGVDLSEFYMSVEWDILEVPAVRYVQCNISVCTKMGILDIEIKRCMKILFWTFEPFSNSIVTV